MTVSKEPDQDLLRRVLKRAKYATSNLASKGGADHADEQGLISRIKAGMIAPGVYPPSPRERKRRRQLALEVWEDEGGASVRQPPG